MLILKNLEELRAHRNNNIGLVPTMGNLHEGHLSLVEKALNDFDHCMVSIFVNPLQFGPNEDFDKYPRTFEEDVQKLEALLGKFEGKSISIFAPESPETMFPTDHQTSVRNKELEGILCGRSRPVHFEGVCTVVYRLFQLIKPSKAYFGLKDYQQVQIIKRMTKDLLLDVEIVECPIIRSSTGLALSSRNRFLSPQQAESALFLSRSIEEVCSLLKGKDWKEAKDLVVNRAKAILNNKSFHWDYLEIRELGTLAAPTNDTSQFVVLGALYFEQTRLIDNMTQK